MKRSDPRRAETLRVIRRELDIANEVEQIATPPNLDDYARAQRRLEYSERIAKALPLTTVEMLVAISEVASNIDDPAPPSVMTVRRWLVLYLRMDSGIQKISIPRSPGAQKPAQFLYEE